MREKLQVQEIDRAHARKVNVYKVQESKTVRVSARDRQSVHKGRGEYVQER